jgi:DNA invertase Pin-like site-specific DNA recombinase
MKIGYARVSTADQELALQLNALQDAGCEKIFSDKASGTKADRPGFGEALAYAREGDCLVVWKLDRLGRSMKGLIDLAAQLEARKINLRSLTDGIDTGTPSGRFFFNIMAALAAMELELIQERTRAGLEAAKRAGRVGGRRSVMTPAKIAAAKTLLAADTPSKDVADTIGVSVATLYRHIPAGEREA